jgi:hypothetical protein
MTAALEAADSRRSSYDVFPRQFKPDNRPMTQRANLAENFVERLQAHNRGKPPEGPRRCDESTVPRSASL